jgi:hypothetical protein
MKHVPDTALAKSLAEVAAIKREMTELLIELETKATGQVPQKPGAWRHHPIDWAGKYPEKPAI